MPRRYGSDSSVFQTLTTPLTDPFGVPVVNTGNTFGSSPMGVSLREQVQFGLPNASFNLLPPDPGTAIEEYVNPLPYWQIQTTPNITATATFDTTTQTWGIKLDPGTAPSGDYLTLKTRSFVVTDDNLALRQKASLTMAKNGSYAGATQWNLTLSAEYFTQANTSLGTTVIGTVYDNTTWTSISGTTTTGGSAISASAAWVEFTVKLTTTATVSSSTSVTLQSLLLGTSSSATGAFVVTDTFNASGTWTRPTGVTNLIAVVGVGGGGGGIGGACDAYNANTAQNSRSGGSGGSSSWAIIKDLYVGDVSSVTVGVGTAGVGGAGTSFTKATAATTTAALSGASGGAGGATTFGTYLTIPGGGGATSYSAGGVGTAGGVPTSTMYGLALLGSVAGTLQTSAGAAGSASTYGQLPYWQGFTAGAAGSNGTATGGSTNYAGTAGAAGSAGIIGAGGGGGRFAWDGTSTMTGINGQLGGYGAGSGAAAAAARIAATVTVTVNGGTGGNAAANSGAGGGGGGGAMIVSSSSTTYNASTITMTSGAGGSGGAGRIYVVYVA